jgi:ABC-type lipoprotein release transport system permease subunit
MFPDKGWINVYLSTFVLLRPHADLQKVENEFSAVVKEAAGAELESANLSPDQVHFGLQPIANIHLNIFEKGPIPEIGRGNLQEANVVTYSYLLMGISGFILIMAAANFINLSVAGSLKRSKEIGIRKIAGAAQWQIVRQFLGEASLICGISFLLALLSVWGILPVFNQLAGKQIHLPLTGVVLFILEGLGLMIVCTLVVGIYPAIKSSMFSAADTLYNRQKWKGKNGFSKGLMVFQFSLAVSLLSGTIIYYRQMNFISQHDAGYDASGIVQIDLPVFRNINQQAISVFRNELMSQASVKQVSNGQLTPGATVDVHNAGRTISAQKCKVDPFFLPTLSILLLGGRNFSPQFASDSSQSIIVNETLVRTEGWQDPIGRQIQIVDGMGNWDTRTIVGVVKDYHYASLKKKIDPLILEMGQSENVWIKLNKGLTVQGLAGIKNLFTKNFPQYFYQAELLEEDNSNQYTNEQRWKEIISFAAGISLTICCMGLFGVAHFITIKRTKEIGIRKVLGASAWHISALLTRNFLWLVLLSLLIAWPVGWFGMSRWLENFSYRIQITWLDFALTGVLALLITVATVLSQALKTATANPVTSLRTE